MEMKDVKNQVKSVFTPARLKKAAALAVLVSIISAGGAYYHHQKAEARLSLEKQARSEMIAAQASQRGVVLLDEAHVRTLAAEAIGKSESELSFRSVHLSMMDRDDHDGKHDKKHRDGKREKQHDGRARHEERQEHRDHDRAGRHMIPPPPQAEQNAPAAGAAAPQPPAASMEGQQADPAPAARPMTEPGFHPVYKVKCLAGNVEYKLRIDAVTGTVLSSKAEAEDDIF